MFFINFLLRIFLFFSFLIQNVFNTYHEKLDDIEKQIQEFISLGKKEHLKKISSLNHLKELNLNYRELPTGFALDLKNNDVIEFLNLENCYNLNISDLNEIFLLKNLYYLNLSECQLRNNSLIQISNVFKLKRLILSGNRNITINEFKSISKVELKELELNDCDLKQGVFKDIRFDKLESFSVRNNKKLGRNDYEILKNMPNLKKLNVSSNNLNSSNNDTLGDDTNINDILKDLSKSLISLDLSDNNINSNTFYLILGFRNLEVLKLRKCSISNFESIHFINKLEYLRVLDLSFNKNLLCYNLESLIELNRLQVLNLEDTQIGNYKLMNTSCLTELRSLNMRNTNHKLENLVNIESLYKLRELHLDHFTSTDYLNKILESQNLQRLSFNNNNNNYTPKSDNYTSEIEGSYDYCRYELLRNIHKIKNLKSLRIDFLTIEKRDDLESIGDSKKLQKLIFHKLKIENRALVSLIKLKTLEYFSLDLERDSIDFLVDFSMINSLTNLKVLKVKSFNLNKLLFDNLINLEYLSLIQKGITGSKKEVFDLSNFSRLKRLKKLTLSGFSREKSLVKDFFTHFKNFDELIELDLSDNESIDYSNVQGILKIKNLKKLNLNGCNLPSDYLKNIKYCKTLEVLYLRNTKIDKNLFKEIDELENIKELDLDSNSVSENRDSQLKNTKSYKVLRKNENKFRRKLSFN